MNIRRRGRAGKLSTLVLALAVGLLAGGAAGYLGSGWFRAQETSRGGTRAPLELTRITALGRLEPRDGIVTISGLPGDRIEEILVQPGRQVTKGTPLARLASHEERRLARDLVQTQLNEAQAQKAELERQKQAQLEEIDAEIGKIRSGQEQDLTAQDARIALIATQERLARVQLERLKSLKLTQVSQQELDQQALQVEQAERERTAAVALRRKTLDTYQQSEAVALAKRKATEASFNRHLKEVPVESLAQNLKLAEHRYQEATLSAPGTGQVLRILARAGESSGQAILEMGDTRHMVAVAEVHETDVQALRNWPAVSVAVTSPALKDPQGQARELTGRLDSGLIGRMVARNTNFSPNPREDRDRRVVDVDVLVIEPANVDLAAQFVNLQVTVTFSRKER